MRTEPLIRGVLVGGAAVFGVTGAWAFVDPSSFYEEIATYPPYNRHFLHDVGAFQLGLAAALLLALTRQSGRGLALWAVSVAAVMHALSHFIDTDLGGRASDPYALSLLAAVLLAAALLTTRGTTARKTTAHEATPLPTPPEVTDDATASPPGGVRPDHAVRTPQQD